MDAMLDRVDGNAIKSNLGGVIQKETLLITDDEKSYAAFAKAYAVLHVWIIVSKGEHVWEGCHVQTVNAYTSNFKTWMVRFRGVATKYLDSYLGWRPMVYRDGDGLPAARWLSAAVANAATCWRNTTFTIAFAGKQYQILRWQRKIVPRHTLGDPLGPR